MAINSFAQDLITGQRIALSVDFSYDEVDGFHIAECLEIPGCMAQGKTLEECKTNLASAIKACVSVIIEDSLVARVEPGAEENTTHAKLSITLNPTPASC